MLTPFAVEAQSLRANQPLTLLATNQPLTTIDVYNNFSDAAWNGAVYATNPWVACVTPNPYCYNSWNGTTPQAMPAAMLAQIAGTGVLGIRILIDPGPLVLAQGTTNFATLAAPIISAVNNVISTKITAGPYAGSYLKAIVDMHVRPQGTNPTLCVNQVTIQTDISASPCWGTFVSMEQQLGALLEADFGAAQTVNGVLGLGPSLVGFELFNEPVTHSFPVWGPETAQDAARVRQAMPSLTELVAGNDYAGWTFLSGQGLLSLVPSLLDGNTIIVTHIYFPQIFAAQSEQGEYCGSAGSSYVQNMEWPPNPALESTNIANANAVIAADSTYITGTLGTTVAACQTYVDGQISNYYSSNYNAAYIDGQIANVAAWADSNGIARNRIWVGEFGVVSSSPFGLNVQVPNGGGSGDSLAGASNASKEAWLSQMVTSIGGRGMGIGPFAEGAYQPGYSLDDGNGHLICAFMTALGLTAPSGCV